MEWSVKQRKDDKFALYLFYTIMLEGFTSEKEACDFKAFLSDNEKWAEAYMPEREIIDDYVGEHPKKKKDAAIQKLQKLAEAIRKEWEESSKKEGDLSSS